MRKRRRKKIGLSIVVPAFNEENRIENAVRRIARHLRASGVNWELIVVDDGSTDSTPDILKRLAPGIPRLRIMRAEINRGKGYAIRRGLVQSRGETVIFTDCDLSTPVSEIPRAAAWIKRGYDMAIGSRAVPGARITALPPLHRRISSRIFHWISKIYLGLRFADTQCGFKAFNQRTAQLMAREGTINGFAFDIELLLVARRRKLKVIEFPIVWRDRSNSKISVLRHSPAMLASLFGLRKRFQADLGFHQARMMPLILLSVLCAVVAQIFFKHGALALPRGLGLYGFVAAIAGSYWVWLGIASYGISAVAWLTVLARADLSFAFPMLSLGFVFATLYARIYLLESLSWNRILGIAMVISGVVLIAASGHSSRETAQT